jgi:hypothetical protein
MSQFIPTEKSKTLSIPVSEEIPWIFLAASIISAIILIITRTRKFLAWLLPLGLAGAGTALIFMERREFAIEEKEARILEELGTLDPLARAQVLIRVTEKELGRKQQ